MLPIICEVGVEVLHMAREPDMLMMCGCLTQYTFACCRKIQMLVMSLPYPRNSRQCRVIFHFSVIHTGSLAVVLGLQAVEWWWRKSLSKKVMQNRVTTASKRANAVLGKDNPHDVAQLVTV